MAQSFKIAGVVVSSGERRSAVMEVPMEITWISSYPRSGNTFLRTVLNHCFHLKSTSVYPGDLGNNEVLKRYVGHVEVDSEEIEGPQFDRKILVKTHGPDKDTRPAIYILRDGRAAMCSLWKFYNQSISMSDLILGNHRFGKWSDHVKSWNPRKRPNCLFLKYEDIERDLPQVLNQLSDFLHVPILSQSIPVRDEIAKSDGVWVREKTDWRTQLTDDELALFEKHHGDVLKDYGYL